MELIPLSSLRAGESAWIRDVDGSEVFLKRLCEMGLSLGAEVRMIQPGAPCILAVRDQRLSLRGEDELGIYVEVQRA